MFDIVAPGAMRSCGGKLRSFRYGVKLMLRCKMTAKPEPLPDPGGYGTPTSERPALSPGEFEARSRVLAVAAGVFRDRGFHQATMDEVARLSRTSKKTIYKIFGSKEVLFLSLMGNLKCEISLLPIDASISAEEALKDFLLRVARILLDDKSLDLLRTILRAQSENPDLVQAAEISRPEHVSFALEDYLAGLEAAGTHEIGVPHDASRMLMGLALGAFHHEMLLGLRRSVPDEALTDRIDRAVTIFLRGTRRAS